MNRKEIRSFAVKKCALMKTGEFKGQYSLLFHLNCKYCGVLFVSKMHDLTRCEKCRTKIKTHVETKNCLCCGKSFTRRASAKIPDRIYCSSKCYNREFRKVNGITSFTHIERARKFNVDYEFLSKRKVLENADYKCYLCGVSVTESTRFKPNSATLDHIIPVSKGGSHTYSNVACCCYACNMRKGNKILL